MKIFLDSSKLSEVKKWLPIISGVTTNPSILLKEGGNLTELSAVIDPMPLSIEVCGDIVSEARKYSSKFSNAVIKIPLLTVLGDDNLGIIKMLSSEGVVVNCTALMSLSQIILATLADPRYVSLFAGRVEDEGGESYTMVEDCVNFLDKEASCTELIVGSIRTVGNVLSAVNAGAHIVTIPPAILEKMRMHQYSLETVKQFESDYAKL